MSKREYYITDGEKFVKQNTSGKYVFISNPVIADVWESIKVAEAILQNSLPRALSPKFYVAHYDNGNFTKVSLSEVEKRSRRERLTVSNNKDKVFTLNLYSFDDDEEVQKLIRGFEDVREIFKATVNKYRTLEESLCAIDYIDEDLTHYLGRKSFNAFNGYRHNNIKQKVFLKRVSIKNQIEIVKKLNKHYEETIHHIEDICNTIAKLRTQVYKPRVLPDLFENDELPANIDEIMEGICHERKNH